MKIEAEGEKDYKKNQPEKSSWNAKTKTCSIKMKTIKIKIEKMKQ